MAQCQEGQAEPSLAYARHRQLAVLAYSQTVGMLLVKPEASLRNCRRVAKHDHYVDAWVGPSLRPGIDDISREYSSWNLPS